MSNEQPKQPPITVLSASAGSGKTQKLTEVYLEKLLHNNTPHPFREILAITFTNAAALEMKERITLRLKELALSGNQKASAILNDLFRHYHYFSVQTIDSFIKKIIACSAFSLGLPARFQIVDLFENYLAYSYDEVITNSNTNPRIRKTFDQFLDHYLKLARCSGWNPKTEIFKEIARLFETSNTHGEKFLTTKPPLTNHQKLTTQLFSLFQKLQKNLPEKTAKQFATALNDLVKAGAKQFNLADLSKYFQREEIPVNKGGEIPSTTAQIWDQIRQLLKELAELEAESYFSPYLDIINLINVEFDKLMRAEELIFLPQLNYIASRLFVEGLAAPSDLYVRLATRFRHYLLDEFQDTNPLQWKNLSPLIGEALGSGGTLFYVGDPKQAIYRFRGGDPEIFNQAANQFPIPAQKKLLEKNYRSREELVNFNNALFSPENIARFLQERNSQKNAVALPTEANEAILAIYQNSQQQTDRPGSGGLVSAEYVEDADQDETIKQKTVALVKELQQRYPLGEIAILARDNKNIEEATGWLLEAGIPVQSDKTLSVRENRSCKELISLLQFLNSPTDDLPFASFILGEIFLTAAGLERAAIADFIFQYRQQKEEHYLYRAFSKKYPQLWVKLIEPFFRAVGFVPPYELLISIYSRFNLPTSRAAEQVFLMKLLELAKDEELEVEPGLAHFLDFLKNGKEEKFYVEGGGSNALRLLTIHRAKGLAFGIVILPFFSLNTKDDDQLLVQEGSGLSLVKIKKESIGYSDKLRKLYQNELKKSLADELNNAYVATTRARDELHIIVAKKSGRYNNLAPLLFPSLPVKKGSPVERPTTKVATTTSTIPPAVYADWIPLLKNEFLAADAVRNREARRRGEILHSLLAGIGNLTGQEVKIKLAEAAAATRQIFPHDSLEEPLAVVKKIISQKKFRPFFYPEGGEVFCEKEVLLPSGRLARLDRLIVFPNEVWVVDYKSSTEHSQDSAEQLRGYLELIGSLFPGQKARGWLIYLDEERSEEIAWNG